ncbi:MAG TPA: malectin domain-containing carbohydrate-binding protein, partial [bacterium]
MKRISFSKFFPIILIALILPQLLFAQVAPKLNEITKTADVLETLGNDITLYRVNAGGNVNYVDHEGNTWNKDQQYSPGGWGYVGGNTHVKVRSINNTQDDELYQSERYGMSAYRFDVANGTYRAVLHFAEIYYRSTNKRVFDVIIEGIKVLDDYDIYADVGANTAVFKTYETTVSDGRLDIDFVTEIDASKISAIEIIAINQDQDPLLSVIPTTLDFGTTMYEMSFTIQNTGGGTLDWSAAENPDQAWLTSIAPNYGTLEAGASETVTIAVDRAELDDGDYNGIILVTSNGGEQDVTIAMHVRSSTGILYVKNLNGSSGAWQGKSPVFTSISAAASNAVDGDEIWVATGEYVENIQLKVGIKLYGGFEGDENSLGDRGDVWDDISRTTINAQNSGRCILAFSNNVIDGFKLINGNHDEGGGVYISNESNIEI